MCTKTKRLAKRYCSHFLENVRYIPEYTAPVRIMATCPTIWVLATVFSETAPLRPRSCRNAPPAPSPSGVPPCVSSVTERGDNAPGLRVFSCWKFCSCQFNDVVSAKQEIRSAVWNVVCCIIFCSIRNITLLWRWRFDRTVENIWTLNRYVPYHLLRGPFRNRSPRIVIVRLERKKCFKRMSLQ